MTADTEKTTRADERSHSNLVLKLVEEIDGRPPEELTKEERQRERRKVLSAYREFDERLTKQIALSRDWKPEGSGLVSWLIARLSDGWSPRNRGARVQVDR